MLRLTMSVLLMGCLTPVLPQTVIKMGTLAPEGSPWHEALQLMAQRWRTISGGQIKLVIYPEVCWATSPTW
jgi:TRAP-type C4-dicarboxylate transport system substrate-binding protein